MRWIWAAVPGLSFLLLLAGAVPERGATRGSRASADPLPADAAPQEYERFVEEFLAFYFWLNPTRATELGVHDYDGRLPDLSREGVQAATDAYRRWLERLQAIDRSRLTGDAYWDYEILDHAIRAELFDLEEVRGWERNPLLYVELITDGLAGLATREFAPASERLRGVIQRERQIPSLLAEARRNLANPPRIFTQLAVSSARGALSFLRLDVPAAFRDARRGALNSEFRAVNDAALAELESFVAYLEDDLLPRSNGDFRLGPQRFATRMRLEQHIDVPLDDLFALSEREIQRYRAWIEGEARRLDPGRPPAEVIAGIAGDYPSTDSLLAVARTLMSGAKAFVVEKRILTLPSEVEPLVRAMPDYVVGSFASMSPPGPFETGAAAAYYDIKLTEPGWTPEQVAQHLTHFNRPGLAGITIHETFPGHFVQLGFMGQVPGRVRKVFHPESLVEGWAHYAEEMMLDAGFGAGDPRLRVAQLRRALQRLARLRAGLLLHTRGASVEDAAREFAQVAYFDSLPALREAERGTYDPLYGYYTLGKMQIVKLRQDYQRYVLRRGESFSLREFHDRLLRTGAPVAIARRILMPGDTAPSLE
ncbi:MAG: DUF885 domain-containing protein [Gemmatimonadetes bacterium]|nr:DUF885 domain-containing protein [Gemmatimonadota bacterium]